MKKIKILLLGICIFLISSNVCAEEYKTNTLIPVDTKATVGTDKFDYKNFVYDSNVDAKGNANLKFESIQNNTLSKIAVSINVLLFDENQKNIGFLTYCTDKDVSSEYAGFKVTANQVVPFNITVTNRYFVRGKLPKDVKYIAVRDENKYCQIGGYDNYAGLTIEEIVNGAAENKSSSLGDLPIGNILKYLLYIVLIAIFIAIIKVVAKTIKNSVANRKEIKKEKEIKEKTVDLSYSDSNKGMDLEEENEISSGGIAQAIAPIEEPEEDNTPEDMNSIEALYNSISGENTPEEKIESIPEESSSVQNLYDSINDVEEQKTESKEVEKAVSIDDLYDSINQDDDEE